MTVTTAKDVQIAAYTDNLKSFPSHREVLLSIVWSPIHIPLPRYEAMTILSRALYWKVVGNHHCPAFVPYCLGST